MAGAPKGNTNAAKENRLITDALRRAAVQNPNKLRTACEKVITEAANGNLHAFAFLADRLDGRPAQAINVGGQEDNPIVTEQRTRPKLDKKEWLKAHGIDKTA